jgi:rhodanese-related sulfurtransferase
MVTIMVKKAAELVAEANAAVGTLTVEEAKQLIGRDDVQFVDVRDAAELSKNGWIPGALHATRGLIEFYADPTAQVHKPELASGKRLILYCASGGRSALAAKTLKDMGLGEVTNMIGGFTAWSQAGGPIER